MKIQISSGGPDDARDVTIEEEGEKPVSFKAKDLADAHDQIKQGRKEGWDSLKVAPKPAPAAGPKADDKPAPAPRPPHGKRGGK